MNSAHGSYREQAAHESLHRRTPGIVADAQVGALVVAGGQSVRAHRRDAIDYDAGRARGAVAPSRTASQRNGAQGGGGRWNLPRVWSAEMTLPQPFVPSWTRMFNTVAATRRDGNARANAVAMRYRAFSDIRVLDLTRICQEVPV
jgi:hypothetical protein